MLSTLSHPMQNDIKPSHDYASYKANSSRYSPPESPRNLPSFFSAHESSMNSGNRGLPPPLGMNLHPPERGSTSSSALGHLPAPPAQWSGQDESMRNWLQAKAEEDRRKQEEERTKQETLRLDQRKIEQTMLRESLQGGVPPPMVPLIFAGMGGGNLPNHTLEWAQQYLAQLSIQNQQQQQQIQAQQQQLQHQQHQQPQHPSSPDMRRDSRMIPANPYGAPAPLQSSAPPAPNHPQPPSRAMVPGPQPSTSLSRLNTVDVQPLPSNTGSSARQPLQSGQQSSAAQSDQNSGPSLFFHHWTPPNNSNQPPTPSGKSQQGSPFSQHAASHLRSEYQNSPKKRKVTGGAPSTINPTSQPLDTSPPPSSHRDHSPGNSSLRRPHSRRDSDSSSRETERPIARPSSRQRRQEELSGNYHSSRQGTGSSMSGSGEDHQMR